MGRRYKDYHRINNEGQEEKQCKACENWFIMNSENFGTDNSNKDKFNQSCKTCQRAYNNMIYMKDPEARKKQAMQWKKDNPENLKKSYTKYNSKPSHKESRRKTARKRTEEGKNREWQRKNKDKVKEYVKYKSQHGTHNITSAEWNACKEYFDNECAYCGLDIAEHFRRYLDKIYHCDLHKEHVDDDGGNDLSNCVPSCLTCNSSKWKYKFDEWYNINNPVYSEERYNRILQWLQVDFKQYIMEKGRKVAKL